MARFKDDLGQKHKRFFSEWEFKGEGNANIVFGYKGTSEAYVFKSRIFRRLNRSVLQRDCILRLAKIKTVSEADTKLEESIWQQTPVAASKGSFQHGFENRILQKALKNALNT